MNEELRLQITQAWVTFQQQHTELLYYHEGRYNYPI